MRKNVVLLTLTLASSTLLIAAVNSGQQPQDEPKGQVQAQAVTLPKAEATQELEKLRRECEQLRAMATSAEQATDKARSAAADARRQGTRLEAELGEALDRIAHQSITMLSSGHSSSCRPSRSLLTNYQWMQTRGHEKRAAKILTKVIDRYGKSTSSLNSLAWDLMSRKECTGKFNEAALALAERMQKRGRLRHNQLDTVALAMFLNGRIDEAATIQKLAVKESSSSEYRRRLMVYEAALKIRSVQTEVAGGE